MSASRVGEPVQHVVPLQRCRSIERMQSPEPVDLAMGRGPAWLDDQLRVCLPNLVELRRRIHMHPELSRHEHATTALIVDALGRADVTASLLPAGTGLIAQLDGAAAGPVIALRADLDALPLLEATGMPFASVAPGVAHACGHDVHTAVLLGVTLALAAAPQLQGTVRLLFQPAEEVMPGGSHDLIAAGAMDGVDLAYALHCDPRIRVGKVGLRAGPITSACDVLRLEVEGAGGHTSRPQLTTDVVSALAEVAVRLPALVAAELGGGAGTVVAWGAVNAGQAPNVIPESGTLHGTIRVATTAAWRQAENVVVAAVAALLKPAGVRYRLGYIRGVPPVDNDIAAVEVLRAGVAAALGPDALVPAEQSAGGEDFAVLLGHTPGALARLGVWDGVSRQADLHSAEFRADERAIAVGVRTLVHTVLAANSSQ